MNRFLAKSTDVHEDCLCAGNNLIIAIYYAMLSKLTYLSVLKHPHDYIHQPLEVDHVGN
jgi:hypothetical protein